MEYSAKTPLPLYTIGIIYPFVGIPPSLKTGIIFTHIHLYHWEESKKGSKDSVLAINAEGGESISPKQKDRTTMPISKIFETKLKLFSIGIFEIRNPLRNSISIGIYILRRSFQKLMSKIFDLLSNGKNPLKH